MVDEDELMDALNFGEPPVSEGVVLEMYGWEMTASSLQMSNKSMYTHAQGQVHRISLSLTRALAHAAVAQSSQMMIPPTINDTPNPPSSPLKSSSPTPPSPTPTAISPPGPMWTKWCSAASSRTRATP